MRYKTFLDNLFVIVIQVLAVLLISFVFLALIFLFLATTPQEFLSQLSSSVVQWALLVTFGSSFAACLLLILFSIPTGYFLSRSVFRGKAILETLIVDLPLSFPPVVHGIILLLIFSPLGPFGRILAQFNVVIPYTFWAVVMAKFFIAMPFVLSFSKQAFDKIDKDLENVARTLGASEFQVFITITLPSAFYGIITGILLALSKSLGEIGATLIFAGGYTVATKTMPILIYTSSTGQDYQTAIALTILLELLTLGILLIFKYVLRITGETTHG